MGAQAAFSIPIPVGSFWVSLAMARLIILGALSSGVVGHGHVTRKCPALPTSQAGCPIKNITDPLEEFEPVCVKHFPARGGALAEYQTRRCMNGDTAPYYQDSQGVFRCSCCGAPLWKPSQQFDQLPVENWGWPSFHSPPINGDDGLPNVCHVGEGVPGEVTAGEMDDLGLHVPGAVRCARCGVHLGDYYDDDKL